MSNPELTHLQLLAEVDSLVGELVAWADSAPDWPPARSCRALVRRLAERTDTMRVRLEAPLVVATLGGTGTGKSALVNALVGSEVTPAGRERPTTRQPTLICRASLVPEDLGIDANEVHLVRSDASVLRDLVVIDCPDPDTTEDGEQAGTNLARLRRLLPHCDVLLITATQQKYRSARVLEELASAAPGARLVFVQTHADVEEDIRDDWRRVLETEYRPGEIYFVDSLAALADAKAGLRPRGDFARLVDLLTRELAGAAGHRIRRANFLELVDETLAACQQRIEAAQPAVAALEEAITDQRAQLATRLAEKMRGELLASRRQWESRLLTEVTSRWGYSPFALVLRAYQGLGALLSGAVLMRVRTPAQLALWGAFEGGRALQRHRRARRAETGLQRVAAWGWSEGELRTASIIIDGYAADAGLRREAERGDWRQQYGSAAATFVAQASDQLQAVVARLAARHIGWFTRLRYELALLVVLGLLLYRLGRNYFYDSWIAPERVPVYGFDFLLVSGFWLLLWCALLLWAYTGRLRRGMRGEIDALATRWADPAATAGLFGDLEATCREIERFSHNLQRLHAEVHTFRERLIDLEPKLGHRLVREATPAPPHSS